MKLAFQGRRWRCRAGGAGLCLPGADAGLGRE